MVAADSAGKGVSIDGAGYVWRAGWGKATRIDVQNGTYQVYDGLDPGAYSYSDMTGFGVANAAGCKPEG